MKGFRIKKIKLIRHPILGSNEFIFYDEKDKEADAPYFTVIIGPNGTGKSEILRCLLLIFRDFYQNHIDKTHRQLQFLFSLEYSLEGKDFVYGNIREGTFINLTNPKKAFPIPKLYNEEKNLIEFSNEKYYDYFPLQIVAQSILLTDKFFVPKNADDTLGFAPYHYLGIRNRPQQSSTGFYVRRTVDLIAKAIEKEYFKKGIKNLIEYIDASSSLMIQYKTSKTKEFYNGNLTAEVLEKYFGDIEKKYKNKQAPYKLSHFNNLKKSAIKLVEVVDFVNKLSSGNFLSGKENSSAKYLNFDLLNDSNMKFLKANLFKIDWLRKIGLLSVPTIKFSDKDVELHSASSGEFHLFTTMIGLMASTRKNTLVVIDEPEISLHPNWQMRYIQFIKDLFQNTDRIKAHIVICTHSHFLISDLPGKNSNIIGLKKGASGIEAIEINKDTYGWSAEEVLYKVFNVKTTRNYYLESDLRELLHGISTKSDDKARLNELLDRIKSIGFSENDPINKVVERADNYLND